MKRIALLSSLALALLVSGCGLLIHQESTDVPPRFSQVSTNVFRSGQPTTPAQWAFLQMHGITDVVKLNSSKGDELAERFGITVHYCNISTWEQIFGPVTPKLNQAFEYLQRTNQVVLVHCTRGVDRTGTLIIMYRIAECGWTKEAAIAEAKSFGWTDMPALKSAVRKLPEHSTTDIGL